MRKVYFKVRGLLQEIELPIASEFWSDKALRSEAKRVLTSNGWVGLTISEIKVSK